MSGGVKQIFRQAETLKKNGFNASVLLQGKSKQKWFHSDAQIAHSPYLFKLLKYILGNRKITFIKKIKLWFLNKRSIPIDKNTILVFPEIYGDKIDKIAPNIKKVIFNQNCYYTFPKLNTYKMTLGIDTSIFSYSSKKQKQICFMPRKLTDDVRQVILILKLRGVLSNWSLVSIDNKNELEVANIMKESVFFLSFNHREGFGLPPIEAMACGCYVIGYHGEGGREYFNPKFSSSIEGGNIIEYVKKVEELLLIYEKSPEIIIEKGKKASDFILSNYSMEREEKDTISIWNNILHLFQPLL